MDDNPIDRLTAIADQLDTVTRRLNLTATIIGLIYNAHGREGFLGGLLRQQETPKVPSVPPELWGSAPDRHERRCVVSLAGGRSSNADGALSGKG